MSNSADLRLECTWGCACGEECPCDSPMDASIVSARRMELKGRHDR
jgi:L-lactate utilization protein LutB